MRSPLDRSALPTQGNRDWHGVNRVPSENSLRSIVSATIPLRSGVTDVLGFLALTQLTMPQSLYDEGLQTINRIIAFFGALSIAGIVKVDG